MLPAATLLAAEDHAPLPEKLAKASAVYLVNDSGDLKAFDRFYQELRKWNRFRVVASRNDAEVVMVLTTVSNSQVTSGGAATTGGVTTGLATTVPIPALQLKVLDASTDDVLWSDVTDKWMSSGHAPSKLLSNLKKRMPKQ